MSTNFTDSMSLSKSKCHDDRVQNKRTFHCIGIITEEEAEEEVKAERPTSSSLESSYVDPNIQVRHTIYRGERPYRAGAESEDSTQ